MCRSYHYTLTIFAALAALSAADWENMHMQDEHNIYAYDANSFFTLHDLNNDGVWDSHEIRALYGTDHDANIPEHISQSIEKTVLDAIDRNRDGVISLNEWLEYKKNGGSLPDPGITYNFGHHFDEETDKPFYPRCECLICYSLISIMC
ncbi:putative calcium-binding protein [Neolecta irregularis DAH-3]|uniref:Putative calcium-binding protein n=1 Tax=Neolecta irregularis (strain DAH-3) TaxID=1198029 RepID=A0A1U7LWU3_NEOID|nr:putative calcium-binding protein [Neolecta irregularis DAH-3]|eukprot:OLL27089.1 putative calcium-binding protein [Neolecta irregularis DAH-3]